MACCIRKLSEAQPVEPARVRVLALPLQNSLECTAQGFMPKHEPAAQRLVRDDALPSQQKLIGEIAGQAMEQCCRNAKYRRSMQPPAEFLGEFHISDRYRGRRIDRARNVGLCDSMNDQPNEVVAFDPGHPLLSRSHRAAQTILEWRQ